MVLHEGDMVIVRECTLLSTASSTEDRHWLCGAGHCTYSPPECEERDRAGDSAVKTLWPGTAGSRASGASRHLSVAYNLGGKKGMTATTKICFCKFAEFG